MVGYNGHPLYFNNALDSFRRILFHNSSQAERVHAEFLGDPSEVDDQDRPGPYREHVAKYFRTRPHKLRDTIDELRGQPPAHIMLAAYSGNMCLGTTCFQPEIGICVIATQRNVCGQVIVSVWQRGIWFDFPEGMMFDLLDDMDGNVPAIMVCGALRVDDVGNYPQAPENIHQLWRQAEAFFLAEKGSCGETDTMILRNLCLSNAGWWLKGRLQYQWQQQQEYRRWIVLQQQTLIQQSAPLAIPSPPQLVSAQQSAAKAANSKKRRKTDGAIPKRSRVQKRLKAK